MKYPRFSVIARLTVKLAHLSIMGYIICSNSFSVKSTCCCRQVASVMSDSVRPHRRQSTRLRRPWDSPGKNTGVGCHFLLQCMKVKMESEVAQSCPTLHDPMDCSLPGFSIHGIFQARVLEWVAMIYIFYLHCLKCSEKYKVSYYQHI